MISRIYRLLAWMSCIGMFMVLLAGALVTNTGSGRGCGDDWPLCNGQFIPAFTLETAIEYSHRAVTGLVGLVVAATFLATILLYRRSAIYREALWYSAATLFFTILQAIMGAAAVIRYQSPAVMALHFGISLMAVASTVLLLLWVQRLELGGEALLSRIPRSAFSWFLISAVYSYVVVYLGAFIRHTDSGGGCLGWPLCNGEFVPELNGATGIVFIHRIAGLVLFLVLLGLYRHLKAKAGSGDPAVRSALWVLILVICQIFSGAWLTYTLGNEDWFIFTNMLHNFIVTIMFSILLDLGIQVRKRRDG